MAAHRMFFRPQKQEPPVWKSKITRWRRVVQTIARVGLYFAWSKWAKWAIDCRTRRHPYCSYSPLDFLSYG